MTDDLIKIAVTNTVSGKSGSAPLNHLLELSKSEDLTKVVANLCSLWKLSPPEDYALKFDAGTKEFVTDRNKQALKNGSVLKFCQSPRRTVRDLVAKLGPSDSGSKVNEDESRLYALKALETNLYDYSFAFELVNGGGLDLVLSLVTGERGEANANNAGVVGSVVHILHEVMKHDELVQWEDPRIGPDVIRQIAASIDTDKTMMALKFDEKTFNCCLVLLEQLVLTPCKYELTEPLVPLPSLLNFLQTDEPTVQMAALALFNAMFKLGDRTKKRKMKQVMEERHTRRRIVECIINKKPNHDMKQQLYLLQALLLNLLEDRMLMPVESKDPKLLEKIVELRKLAFDSGPGKYSGSSVPSGSESRTKFAEEYKRLGFTNEIDPTQEFKETPPGMLALDIMYSFAVKHTEDFVRLVLESSHRGDEHDCPFAKVSVKIVKLMCNIIGIGREPKLTQNSARRFLPMFYTHEHPLEEMFAITIQHVHKTWREMRASIEDLKKVLEVAEEQIKIALAESPKTLEDYKKALKSYSDISGSRKEAMKNKAGRQGEAIMHLRAVIKPEIMELIQRQRLLAMTKGTRFHKYRKEGKGKFVFVRLSQNHKSLHYGEWEEEQLPSVEHLDHKLQISEIKDFTTGPSIMNSQNRSRKDLRGAENFLLHLLKENQDALEIVAPDKRTYDHWCDGLNALLRRDMVSCELKTDLHELLTMEEKIRLLPLEGIEIPTKAPPVPPLPPDFNFCQEMA